MKTITISADVQVKQVSMRRWEVVVCGQVTHRVHNEVLACTIGRNHAKSLAECDARAERAAAGN